MELKNPRWIWLKGVLFFVLGTLASALLLLHSRSLTVGVLLAIAVWAYCRCYYFAFYVIEHYIDSEFHYSGLLAFLRYALSRRASPGR